MDGSRRRIYCNAEVQCDLPAAKPCNAGPATYVREQVFWVQRNIFSGGRFISVRELGTQTDAVQEEASLVSNRGSSFDTAVVARPALEKTVPADVPLSNRLASLVQDEPLPSSRAGGVSQEVRALKKSPRPRKRPPGNALTEEQQQHFMQWRQANAEKQMREVQQQMLELTNDALGRACALEEHVQDLNCQASIALIESRHFQSQFNPKHAFECGSRSRRSLNGCNSEEASHREGSKTNAGSKQLPDLKQDSAASSHIPKMPWQEWSDAMSGTCPTSSLGSKVLLSSVEPWRPAILNELPAIPRLQERLAMSAAVYGFGEKPVSSRQRKAAEWPFP